jgi:hypothetical protein
MLSWSMAHWAAEMKKPAISGDRGFFMVEAQCSSVSLT